MQQQGRREEAEALLSQLPVMYPSEPLLRLAIRGAATYGLSWFDAHICKARRAPPVCGIAAGPQQLCGRRSTLDRCARFC